MSRARATACVAKAGLVGLAINDNRAESRPGTELHMSMKIAGGGRCHRDPRRDLMKSTSLGGSRRTRRRRLWSGRGFPPTVIRQGQVAEATADRSERGSSRPRPIANTDTPGVVMKALTRGSAAKNGWKLALKSSAAGPWSRRIVNRIKWSFARVLNMPSGSVAVGGGRRDRRGRRIRERLDQAIPEDRPVGSPARSATEYPAPISKYPANGGRQPARSSLW